MSFDLKISNGDLVLNNGDLKIIEGIDKLSQDLLKMAVTSAGALPFHPWYGSFISRTLIGSPLGTNIVIQVAQSQLQNSIENLMSLQKTQIQSFQNVSPDELIGSIVDISINRNNLDPGLFDVRIKVMSKGYKVISTNFKVDTI